MHLIRRSSVYDLSCRHTVPGAEITLFSPPSRERRSHAQVGQWQEEVCGLFSSSVLDPLSLKTCWRVRTKTWLFNEILGVSCLSVINLSYTRIKKKNQITNDLADYCTMGRITSTPTLGQPFSLTSTHVH